MRRPGFFKGVLVALVLALIGGAMFAGLSVVLTSGSAVKVIVAVLAGAYVAYLLGCGDARTGRLATFVLWLLGAFASWLIAPNLAVLLCAHVTMIWLIRALHHHASVLAALADLALSCLALGSAVWAAQQSGSVFMAVWCFFLVQALFVAIPDSLSGHVRATRHGSARSDTFERAYGAAESAVRRLATKKA